MTHLHVHPGTQQSAPDLAHRLDEIGWGLFLVLTGLVWLFPESKVPPGTWLLGTGVLLLGLNAVRAAVHMPLSRFTLWLGAFALLGGLSAVLGIQMPLPAIFLIFVGLGVLGRRLFR